MIKPESAVFVPGTVRSIRAGSGLGDSLYLQAIARHLVRHGWQIEACTNHPELFPASVRCSPFRRLNVNHRFHYLQTYGTLNTDQTTSQFEDMCRCKTGLSDLWPVELKLDWTVKNHELVQKVQQLAAGKPILLVHGGRAPMNRTDNFGGELLPNPQVFHDVINCLRRDHFTVYVGSGPRIYTLDVDLDLHDQTSVRDLVDLACASDGIVGQVSFAVPLAESLDKKLLVLFSEAGFKSASAYTRSVTPAKILHKKSSHWISDGWTPDLHDKVMNAFSQP